MAKGKLTLYYMDGNMEYYDYIGSSIGSGCLKIYRDNTRQVIFIPLTAIKKIIDEEEITK